MKVAHSIRENTILMSDIKMIADKQTSASNDTMIAPRKPSELIPALSNIKDIPVHIMLHNIFRVLRPIRMNFGLSVNESILLNGIYLYSLTVRGEFTRGTIKEWAGYWNPNKIQYYISSLEKKGVIQVHSSVGKRIYYRITERGIYICSMLLSDYNKIVSTFLSKFNLSI